jgi:hypothetical protein
MAESILSASGTARGCLQSQDATYNTADIGGGTFTVLTSSPSMVGQTLTPYRIWQMFLTFDCSAIPADAVVSSATLEMCLNSDSSPQDFTINVYEYDWTAPVVTSYWTASTGFGFYNLVASLATSGIGATGAYKTFASETAIKAAINCGGLTTFSVVSSRQGTAPTTNEYLMFYAGGSAYPPKLTITYFSGGIEYSVEISFTNDTSSSFVIGESAIASAPVVDTYASAGESTWTCPAGITRATFEVWGAGGGGSGGYDSTYGGAGGGGGAYSRLENITVTPGTGYTVHVGAGGAGGAYQNNNGVAGGDSWFWNTLKVLAKGGANGEGGANYGLGGDAASGIGDARYSGGNGGAVSATAAGTGGGGSAGTASDGTTPGTDDSSGGAAVPGGGPGGDGGSAPASGPGGGGGGGAASGNGGAGYDGQVKITYYTGGADTLDGFFGAKTWTDVSSDVQRVEISRGRTDDLQRCLAGSCVLELIDEDREYNPQNSGGSYYGSLVPMRPVRVRVTTDGSTYTSLFTGYIETIQNRGWKKENYACAISCVDLFAYLETIYPVTPASTAQYAGDVIETILQYADLPDTLYSCDNGRTINWAGSDGSQTALSLIQSVVDLDGGIFYIAGDGTATFEYYDSWSDSPRDSDQSTPDDDIEDLTIIQDVAHIYNEVTVSWGEESSSTWKDVSSIAKYGVRRYPAIDGTNVYWTIGAENVWDTVLANYAETKVRATCTLNAKHSSTIRDIALARDLWDRVRIMENDTDDLASYHIEQVQHSIDVLAGTHYAAWYLTRRT